MTRIILALTFAVLLSGCAYERALFHCALVDHDINKRCQ